ncbi:MAG: glucose-phosphate thymidylyltransferase [Verrucomicrobiota bacterium]|jgi:dTDP-glucose pyrophosphorylase
MRYGSIPAGGLGTRLQPIGFSKELVPIRRRAVIEYLLDRMILAGIDKIFINTAEDKTDLIRYLATKSPYRHNCVFLVRERKGLLDAIVQPAQFMREDDELYFGLPDTIWFPTNGFSRLVEHPGALVAGLFESGAPHKFDAVVTDTNDRILEVQVKVAKPKSPWTWGIGKVRVGEVVRLLACSQRQKGPRLPLFGVAVHDYAQAHSAYGVRLENSSYVDIGCVEDYESAEAFLGKHDGSASIVPVSSDYERTGRAIAGI